MSARDDLIAGLLSGAQHWMAAGENPVEARRLVDARDAEIRRENAATVRAAKVREPIDETERHLNAVLEDVAREIEGAS
ncbi:hypothetical protein [Streptomyces atriruber]|uniref:hypothetical protein n=1 Tax=Streptomyces atriruber TaxID=545121 RepID=UPI0006E30098|nr:hypothetical protein [Streptomyces atriruber]